MRKALHSKFDNIYELLEETANLICELKSKVNKELLLPGWEASERVPLSLSLCVYGEAFPTLVEDRVQSRESNEGFEAEEEAP